MINKSFISRPLSLAFISYLITVSPAGDKYDSNDSRGKWDDDWERNKGQFPFSEKLGEISDKIGSTIDDTISRFRKKERDDSPDRFRCETARLPELCLFPCAAEAQYSRLGFSLNLFSKHCFQWNFIFTFKTQVKPSKYIVNIPVYIYIYTYI